MRSAAFLVACSTLFLVRTVAAATSDCPPGSFEKSEDGFTWCQPTVCDNDGQCNPGQVCKPVSLCMQIGELADAGAKVDGGSRLVVTQICGEDKTCPTLQTCNSFGRCISLATADKLGRNGPGPTRPDAPKKSSCGCEAVGSSSNGGGIALAGFGAIALLVRARRRASRR